jgi:hypothetical protein
MSATQYKVKCQYIIKADGMSLNDISSVLGIVSTRSFSQGDKHTLIHRYDNSESIMERSYTQWAISSETTINPYNGLQDHLEYFKSIFQNKLDKLASLKEKYNCERTFWVWIEADKPITLTRLEATDLLFIESITDDLVIQIQPMGTSKLD